MRDLAAVLCTCSLIASANGPVASQGGERTFAAPGCKKSMAETANIRVNNLGMALRQDESASWWIIRGWPRP